jgi:hypothetical protein
MRWRGGAGAGGCSCAWNCGEQSRIEARRKITAKVRTFLFRHNIESPFSLNSSLDCPLS